MDVSPDAQAWLTVKAGIFSGSPENMVACLAVLGPAPACLACPKTTKSVFAFPPAFFKRVMASLSASVASCGAVKRLSVPPYLPMGVLVGALK